MESLARVPVLRRQKLHLIAVHEKPRVYLVRCAECGAQGPGTTPSQSTRWAAWNLPYGRLTLFRRSRCRCPRSRLRLLLYAFGHRDELTGKWTKARYRAEHHVIATRFQDTEGRIEGPAERRWPLGDSFSPWRR